MAEKCFNHPDRKSLAPCHSCGKHFCEECLNKWKEYYYCKQDQCQFLLREENAQFEAVEKRKNTISKQRWKENGRQFYIKTIRILFVAWILLTIFLYLIVPAYNHQTPYWLPVISLIVCVKWFVLVWLIRITIYRHLIWERRIAKEFSWRD